MYVQYFYSMEELDGFGYFVDIVVAEEYAVYLLDLS